jgi:hypothetical protein
MSTALGDNGLQFSDGSLLVAALRGYLAGLVLSTVGSSATMSIADGMCSDSTNAACFKVAGTNKTTGAWAVGTAVGGLDTGTIANNTWYYFYAIRRPDTGVTDVCLSLSAVAPTFGSNIPAAYTQYRLLYPWKTNGSAQWVSGTQTGDDFVSAATSVDYNVVNPGSGAVVAVTLGSVPSGLKVDADISAFSTDSAGTCSGYLLGDLAANAETPAPTTNVSAWLGVAGQPAIFTGKIRTNTSAQIRLQMVAASATFQIVIRVKGFTYRRGRDA